MGNEKPGLILSFDDHHIKAWHEYREYFRDNNIRVTFYISEILKTTEDEWKMLKDLQDDGHIIGHHGVNHLRAGVVKDWDEWMQQEIERGFQAFNAHGLQVKHYSYPYGNRSVLSDRVLLKRFNSLRKGGECLYNPRSIPRVFGGVNFGKNSKSKLCGHEPMFKHVNQNIVSFFMHQPIRHRLDYMAEKMRELNADYLTVEDIFPCLQ